MSEEIGTTDSTEPADPSRARVLALEGGGGLAVAGAQGGKGHDWNGRHGFEERLQGPAT